MKIAVVKAGGSGNLIEGPPDPRGIPWLSYRRLRFDSTFLKDLEIGFSEAIGRGWKIVYVPGLRHSREMTRVCSPKLTHHYTQVVRFAARQSPNSALRRAKPWPAWFSWPRAVRPCTGMLRSRTKGTPPAWMKSRVPPVKKRRKTALPCGKSCSQCGSLLESRSGSLFASAEVPGGMGAYLFIELARDGGAGTDALNEIGRSIVDVNGYIAREYLASKRIAVGPALSISDPLASSVQDVDVLVLQAAKDCVSTDELAAIAALSLGADELLFFKRGVPVYYVGYERPTSVARFTTSELRRIAGEFGQRPGLNPILDLGALRAIEQGRLHSRLANADQLGQLANILESRSQNWCTEIEVT